MEFVTKYHEILAQIEAVNPIQYATTRNFIDGAVTRLSPYISRGVISTAQIKNAVLKKHQPYQIQKFLQELAWREYWQRVWQHKGDLIFADLKHPQQNCLHSQMPAAIANAATGIKAIDESINEMYRTGYMHNHVRMYVSSIACNIAQAHWLLPSQWMYYYLLDGDMASNMLSWQWVAGTNASKKHYCNQDNINYYTHSHQQQTFLHDSYENIAVLPIPDVLKKTTTLSLRTKLPQTEPPDLNHNLPLCIYNTYNIDPLWRSSEDCNRVLLLEPSHFNKFAVSENVIKFITALSKNISGIKIFTGEFDELKLLYKSNNIFFKKHPAFLHYSGFADEYEWMYPEVNNYYPSFSAYWKKCERFLK